WPTGHIDRLFNVDANQEVDLVEGSTTDGQIDVDPDVELTIVSNQNIDSGKEILSVFPNPATNSITFQSNNLRYDRYVILNEAGSIVLSGPITGKNQEILTQNFAQGFYHLVIYNQKGDKLISKFMKS
ncbi:MAG: T9SS C-terminal target domain-containing protein, partial [Bacteroidetes bacterium]